MVYFHTKNKTSRGPGNGIFYGYLVYCMAIWYILWQFGIFCGHLVYPPQFWYVVPRKNLATQFGTLLLEKKNVGKNIAPLYI
jgi:hypothetical protein